MNQGTNLHHYYFWYQEQWFYDRSGIFKKHFLFIFEDLCHLFQIYRIHQWAAMFNIDCRLWQTHLAATTVNTPSCYSEDFYYNNHF